MKNFLHAFFGDVLVLFGMVVAVAFFFWMFHSGTHALSIVMLLLAVTSCVIALVCVTLTYAKTSGLNRVKRYIFLGMLSIALTVFIVTYFIEPIHDVLKNVVFFNASETLSIDDSATFLLALSAVVLSATSVDSIRDQITERNKLHQLKRK